jgi:hypothetical protein
MALAYVSETTRPLLLLLLAVVVVAWSNLVTPTGICVGAFGPTVNSVTVLPGKPWIAAVTADCVETGVAPAAVSGSETTSVDDASRCCCLAIRLVVVVMAATSRRRDDDDDDEQAAAALNSIMNVIIYRQPNQRTRHYEFR